MDAGAEVDVERPVDGASSAKTGTSINTELIYCESGDQPERETREHTYCRERKSVGSHLTATGSSVDHMSCFGDAAGRLQESGLDAATKGNRYINSCLRLNEEIKGVENLAARLKHLRRIVDVLDTAVNKLLRPP